MNGNRRITDLSHLSPHRTAQSLPAFRTLHSRLSASARATRRWFLRHCTSLSSLVIAIAGSHRPPPATAPPASGNCPALQPTVCEPSGHFINYARTDAPPLPAWSASVKRRRGSPSLVPHARTGTRRLRRSELSQKETPAVPACRCVGAKPQERPTSARLGVEDCRKLAS